MQMPPMPQIYLRPGEYYFGRRPALIHTVLGSCVAVSVYHRHTGLAAICHAVQPGGEFDCAGSDRDTQPPRYVRCVVPAMIQAFLSHKVSLSELEVKLFGGATLIGNPVDDGNVNSVGALNVAAARQIIAESGLVLHAVDVGGHAGRKLIFSTQTGVVLMKRMQNTS